MIHLLEPSNPPDEDRWGRHHCGLWVPRDLVRRTLSHEVMDAEFDYLDPVANTRDFQQQYLNAAAPPLTERTLRNALRIVEDEAMPRDRMYVAPRPEIVGFSAFESIGLGISNPRSMAMVMMGDIGLPGRSTQRPNFPMVFA